jgi:hypothetical protein
MAFKPSWTKEEGLLQQEDEEDHGQETNKEPRKLRRVSILSCLRLLILDREGTRKRGKKQGTSP